MKQRISNINDYTLIEKGDLVSEIYFYPQCALTNQKIRSKKDQLCVLFELKNEKEPGLYLLHTYLLDKEGKKIFQAYSLYLKELEQYKYAILKSKNDHYHAEIIKKEIIDFNTLDFDSLLAVISKNSEVESLVTEKRKAIYIDLPSTQNYYQNITGNIIDELAKQLTTEDEMELSKEILRNIKKNFKVILHDKYQMDLVYTAIYALIIKNIKGTTIKPQDILDSKDLKIDTNKTSLAYEDLDKLLNSFIESLKQETTINEELNIIEERIEYALSTKPKLKVITDFIKIILIDDKYVDQSKRNRSIEESLLKELIINSLTNCNYRPLPRNQVLLYTENDNNIDFIAIISLDLIEKLLHTYKVNTKDNKVYENILKTIDNIIDKGQHKKTETTLILSIYTLLHISIYNNKYNKNTLLFEKGIFIPKLDFNLGEYEITIINRLTGKKHGKITRMSLETKEVIKKSLSKNEKSFNKYINDLIYKNFAYSLDNLNIDIKIKDLTNNDIKIKINRSINKDSFDCAFTMGEFLNILSNIKISQPKEIKQEEVIEEIEVIEEPTTEVEEERLISQEEYDFIIRKSHTIANILETTNIQNDTYEKVVELYNSIEKATKKDKEKIVLQIKELLK